MSEDFEKLVERYARYPAFWEISGQDPNEKGIDGDALIHMAAMRNEQRDIAVLLDRGADINLRGDLGRTALHYAASYGHSRIARYLLSCGAKAAMKDELGKTPADLAMLEGHVELHFLLKKEAGRAG
jgi:ankyrin repeat protein